MAIILLGKYQQNLRGRFELPYKLKEGYVLRLTKTMIWFGDILNLKINVQKLKTCIFMGQDKIKFKSCYDLIESPHIRLIKVYEVNELKFALCAQNSDILQHVESIDAITSNNTE